MTVRRYPERENLGAAGIDQIRWGMRVVVTGGIISRGAAPIAMISTYQEVEVNDNSEGVRAPTEV